jgi:hypothetical protein
MASPIAMEPTTQAVPRRRRSFVPLLPLIAPVHILILSVIVIPSIYVIWLSLTHSTFGRAPTYVGLENYLRVIADPAVHSALWNTVVLVVVAVHVELALGLLVALLFASGLPFRRLLLVAVLAPYAVSEVTAVVMWRFLFDPDAGPVTQAIQSVGLPILDWSFEPSHAMVLVALLTIWLHLPFTFIKIDHEPNPWLPNGVPNPLLPEKREKASRAVVEHGADIAIAWDGDFDRCFLYDHKGRFVEGYYLVGMIAQATLKKAPGSTILYDPRLTWNTIDVVESASGVAKPCRTGHAYFKQMMRKENAIYGGEMSAHHYFRDFAYCDSGMLAWLDVVCELSATGMSLAETLEERIAAFPCSGEINFTVEDAKAAQQRVADHFERFNPELETIDGLGMVFDDWRFNLRASNTEPLLRLNVETRANQKLLDEKVQELRGLIEGA